METKITSRQHSLVKRYVKLRTQRRFRQQEGCVVVEGAAVIGELLETQAPLSLMVCEDLQCPWDHPCTRASREVIQKASGLEEPPGFLAEFAIPDEVVLVGKRRLLLLDGVQDPGNMGTILRTALAFGWEGVFLLPGCVDPFNGKALQAGKGAAFRLPRFSGTWEDVQALGLEVWVADLEGASPDEVSLEGSLALLLGSEGQGVSEEGKRLGKPVSLPMKGDMESLNVAVAAGILMYLLRN